MKMISEYFSDDGVLSSRVYQDASGIYHVQFTDGGKVIADRSYTGKHLCYVEDAADNYVCGILDINSM